jgi:PAS domain S-box-containing protein
MLKLFTLPTFQDDELTIKSQNLNKIIVGTAFITMLSGFILWFLLPANYIRWVTLQLIMLLVSSGLLTLNWKGYTRAASILYVCFGITMVLGMAWSAGGIRANAIQYLPSIVLIAGLILGWKEALITCLVAILGGLFFVIADNTGILPVSHINQTSMSLWINSVIRLSIFALFQYVIIASIDKALREAREELVIRKKVEEELRTNKAFRERIFESSCIPIVVMDASSSKYIDCNQAATKIYGLSSREETLSINPLDVSAPVQYDGTPSAEKARFYIEKAVSEGSVIFEWKQKKLNGELWDAQVHLMSFKADDQQLLQFTLSDITRRKRTEEILAERNQFIESVIDITPDILFIYDVVNQQHEYISNGIEKLLGYSPGEAGEMGKEFFSLLVHPDDYESFKQKIIPGYSGLVNGERIVHEYRMKHKKGGYRWLLSSEVVYKRNLNGSPDKMFGIVHDVTEQKEFTLALKVSEENFKMIAEASPQAIILSSGIDSKTIYLNKRFTELFGYVQADLPAVTNWWQLAFPDPEYRKEVESLWKKDVDIPDRGNKVIKPTEFIVTCKDGSVKIIEWGSISIGNQNISFGLDITERKRVENELHLNQEKLRLNEQRLSYALSASSDALWEWNYLTGQAYYNSRWFEILGYKDQEFEMTINTWKNLCHPVDYQITMDLITTSIENSNSKGYHAEFRMLHKNGSWRWILGRGNVVLRGENREAILLSGTNTDITERKNAEEALRESELRFRTILQNVESIAVQGYAPDGTTQYWNQASEHLYGYTAQEAIGRNLLDLIIPPEMRADVENAIRYMAETGNAIPASELLLMRKDGSRVAVYSSHTIVRMSGHEQELFCIDIDLSQRKKAEEALQKSEEKFRKAFVVSPDSININRFSDGEYIQINDGFTRIMGYSSQEILGKSSYEMNIWKNIDDRKRLSEGLLKYGTVANLDAEFYAKDGSVKYGLMSAAIIELNNEKHVLSITRDITERKLIEQAFIQSKMRYAELFSKASDGIVTLSTTGRILEVNQSFADMSGFTIDELLQMDINELDSDGGDHLSKDIFSRILNGESLRFEVERKNKDGNFITQEVSASSISIGDEVVIQAFYRDMTERKKAELELNIYRNYLEELVTERTEALNEANDSLKRQIEKKMEIEMMLQQSLEKEKETSELKSKFISTTSHEFRTPLTSALSSTEMLQRYSSRWNNEKKNEHLERIKSSINYLVNLLDDILTISRTETGKISYNPEPVDLRKFAKECVKDAETLSNKHKLKYSFKAGESVFSLDPKLMRFILNNLLSNAVKFSPGGGKIELKISKEGKQLVIEVSDEGIGIPSQEISKIFESFYRSQNSEHIPGTGLGLAIVKRAVDIHDGNIKVNSVINQGTTIVVNIPILV